MFRKSNSRATAFMAVLAVLSLRIVSIKSKNAV